MRCSCREFGSRVQATDCTNAVRIKDAFDSNSFCTDVACSDNHLWCFNCMEEPHAPADCNEVKDWRKKCAVRRDGGRGGDGVGGMGRERKRGRGRGGGGGGGGRGRERAPGGRWGWVGSVDSNEVKDQTKKCAARTSAPQLLHWKSIIGEAYTALTRIEYRTDTKV